jgi:hypothetical protein
MNSMYLDKGGAWTAAWTARRSTLIKYFKRYAGIKVDTETDSDERNKAMNYDGAVIDVVMDK